MTLETKTFELRDEGTFIAVMATAMRAEYPGRDAWLLRRAGYSTGGDELLVVLCRMDAKGTAREASYDPYAWGGRTFPVAHQYIAEHWDTLGSGDLIDVRVILGEATTRCASEQAL